MMKKFIKECLGHFREYFSRNWVLLILAMFMGTMCAFFCTDPGLIEYLSISTGCVVSLVLMLGLIKDTSNKFYHGLLIVFMIGAIPPLFGISFSAQPIIFFITIGIGVALNHLHRHRAYQYEMKKELNTPDYKKNKEVRQKKLNKLLRGF